MISRGERRVENGHGRDLGSNCKHGHIRHNWPGV